MKCSDGGNVFCEQAAVMESRAFVERPRPRTLMVDRPMRATPSPARAPRSYPALLQSCAAPPE
jgi:hypothetical protein